MQPLPITVLPRHYLRFPELGRTCLSLRNRALDDPARGHVPLVRKHLRAQPFLRSKVQGHVPPSSVPAGAISALLPPCSPCEPGCTHRSLNRSSFSRSCSAFLFGASTPAFSDKTSSSSQSPSSSSSSGTPSPSPSSSSSFSAAEQRAAGKSPATGASAKGGSTSAAGAPAKRLTGLHKICDLKGPLASFMGKSEASRIEVIRHVWDHIKRHNLQSAENKKMINADHALKPILQKDQAFYADVVVNVSGYCDKHMQVSMFEMNKLLSKYVQSRPTTSAAPRD